MEGSFSKASQQRRLLIPNLWDLSVPLTGV